MYDLTHLDFVYTGKGEKAGGHSLVCCGYDEESRMLIMQNHWGVKWGLKGFFLCPYSEWASGSSITCWYERLEPAQSRQGRKAKAQEADEKTIEQL